MIKIRNKWDWLPIPFKGFKAINLWGILIIRGDSVIDDITLNHETIHSRQILEIMIITAILTLPLCFLGAWKFALTVTFLSFYIWYAVEYVIRMFRRDDDPYGNMLFEKEAYNNQEDLSYLETRKPFVWLSL